MPRKEHARSLGKAIERKARRKKHALKHKNRILWFGIGTFGLIGWSVMVPTIIGLGVGIWIDTMWPSPFSWTLMLMFAGLLVGCLTAWFWIVRERKSIEEERKNDR